MKKIFLIDGHSQIFRMYYAFMRRPMINSKGVDTSILFGFTKMILEIISKERPTHIAVSFDPPAKTFRHEAFDSYKANRSATPELVKAALEPLVEILSTMNIPVVMMPGFEADDVIGSMATQWDASGNNIYMVTPDKDYGQLITENVRQYKLGKGEGAQIWGPDEVCSQYGITSPKQVIDILTICGDTADNVPGIKGIGEVGAKKLISQYGSIENIIEHLSDLSAKQQETIKASLGHLQMSKFLITIKTDIQLPVTLDDISVKMPDCKAFNSILKEYELGSLRKMIAQGKVYGKESMQQMQEAFSDGTMPLFSQTAASQNTEKPKKQAEPDAPAASELDLFSSFQTEADQAPVTIENLSNKTDKDNFLSKASGAGEISIRITDGILFIGLSDCYTATENFSEFGQLLTNASIAKTGYNIKEQIKQLREKNIELKGQLYDLELMHYVLQPERSHKEEILFKTYLGKDIEMLAQANKNIAAASLMLDLRKKLSDELEQMKQSELYLNIEAPLIPVLADMEYTGVRIDTAHLAQYSKELTAQLVKIEDEARQAADDMFLNLSSPKQIGILLFEKLKLNPKAKKTSTGNYSTDEKILADMADLHPVVNMILEYRGLKKLLSTYIDNLPELISAKDGNLHTTFNQALTSTGRLSSTNPNLQNIPIRTERGKEIRKAFVSQFENGRIISADYSQIELRLMAHMSSDPHLVDAFNKGKDIHTATAAKVFGVPEEEVTKEQRTRAKVANFGIIYGISSFGLSQRLGMNRIASKELIEEYFRNYPKVKEYINNMIEKGRSNGYVETIYGRKRFLPDINSRNATVRRYNERNAINAPLQGSAADIIKVAMISVYKEMEERNLKSKLILQVHDELVFDATPDEADIIKELATRQMENVIKLQVPLVAECGVGTNWLGAH